MLPLSQGIEGVVWHRCSHPHPIFSFAANDVPVAQDDAFSTVDTKTVSGSVATNDVLSANGGNVFTAATKPLHGKLVLSADGTFSYTPTAGNTGKDTFTYNLTDADGDVSSAIVTITIIGMLQVHSVLIFSVKCPMLSFDVSLHHCSLLLTQPEPYFRA